MFAFNIKYFLELHNLNLITLLPKINRTSGAKPLGDVFFRKICVVMDKSYLSKVCNTFQEGTYKLIKTKNTRNARNYI